MKYLFERFPEAIGGLVGLLIVLSVVIFLNHKQGRYNSMITDPQYSKIIKFYPPSGEPIIYESAGWIAQGAACVFTDKNTGKEVSIKGVYTVEDK